MGCDYQDARRVAALIGTKTFLNEFVAYAGKLKLILFIVKLLGSMQLKVQLINDIS